LVDGDFDGTPATSTPIKWTAQIFAGDADADGLERLVRQVDQIAEIPTR